MSKRLALRGMGRVIRTLSAAAAPLLATPALAETYEFVGGHWFDGEKFVERTVYAIDGVLSFTRPASVDQTVDLKQGYVVPPFGEAHNHDLASASGDELDALINQYLWDGVFYVKLQSAFSVTAPAIRARLDSPGSVDAAFAFAPVTGPGGHPIRLRETFFDRGWLDDVFASKDEIAGVGYTLVQDEADLETKWPGLIGQEPDFIKFMLSHSEEYLRRRDDPEFFGLKGLDPNLAPMLVRKAHDAGLRITAHIDTGPDFHYAVAAGVDEIAHLPGSSQPEVISAADALAAAERNVTVITTVMLTTRIADTYPAWSERVMDQHRANLKRLNEAGVTLAVGSDMPYRDTSQGEALLLHQLGVFTNLELLRMWSVNSPKTIFPDRRIGRLEPGYEASFLVLDGDPLEDFLHVTRIRSRFKQGQWLNVAPPPAEDDHDS